MVLVRTVCKLGDKNFGVWLGVHVPELWMADVISSLAILRVAESSSYLASVASK